MTWPATTNFTYICVPPAKPVITHEGGLLTSNTSTNNQWLRNGVVIPGATSQTYASAEGGAYSVRVTMDGCSAESDPTTLVGIEKRFESTVNVYPNPASDVVRIELPGHPRVSKIDIYTMTGVVKYSFVGNGPREELDVRTYADGLYMVVVTTGQGVVTKKFQKHSARLTGR